MTLGLSSFLEGTGTAQLSFIHDNRFQRRSFPPSIESILFNGADRIHFLSGTFPPTYPAWLIPINQTIPSGSSGRPPLFHAAVK